MFGVVLAITKAKCGSVVYIKQVLGLLHDLPLCVISAVHCAALISHTECIVTKLVKFFCKYHNFNVHLKAILGQAGLSQNTLIYKSFWGDQMNI